MIEKGYEWNFVSEDIIEVKNVESFDYGLLVDNFDIIEMITSFKIFRRYPGVYGDSLISQYEIEFDENAPLIGVIDTGVSKVQLLSNVIVDIGLDLTDASNPRACIDEVGHGTAIAGLAAYGKKLYFEDEELVNDARIVPIKVMTESEDVFSISDLLNSIRVAHDYGVRIFSLSINV